MNTVSVDIKIPDGHEVEEVSIVWPGYESSPDCAVGKMVVKTRAAKPFLINGVPSDWPEWLLADWVAKYPDGSLFKFSSEPQRVVSRWIGEGLTYLSGVVAIEIPGDWTQSKRENPRRKNKEVIK